MTAYLKAELLRNLKILDARFYDSDVMVLLDLANSDYALGSLQVANRHGFSRSWGSKHLSKVADWGIAFRQGAPRCCFQKYELRRDGTSPVTSTRILEALLSWFAKHPNRTYVILKVALATVRSPYATMSLSRFSTRRFGRSDGFWCKRFGSVWSAPVYDVVSVPVDVLEQVLFDLDALDIEYSLEKKDDSYEDSEDLDDLEVEFKIPKDSYEIYEKA